MYYRSLLLLITGFWVAMWVLLIRSEVQPGGAGVHQLPVELVLREVFRHERYSTLRLSDGSSRIGSLRLAPKEDATNGSRSLELAGNVSLAVPGGTRQRISWDGALRLSRAWAVESFRLATVTREITPPPATGPVRDGHPLPLPEPARFDLLLEPQAARAAYTVKLGDTVMDQQEFTLDEQGLAGLLTHLGVEETWQKQLQLSQAAHPEITAREASLTVRGIKLETYLLTITYHGQTLLQVYISQIGEILQADSLVGWKLEQE